MASVLANLAAAMENLPGAPRLLAGTGYDETHLLVVCTAERGLCGRFNSSIARLARDHVDRLIADGKTVKILMRRQEGLRHLEAQLRAPDRRRDRAARRARSSASPMPAASPTASSACSRRRDFDVCTIFFAEFKSVIAQMPHGAADIPVKVREVESTGAGDAVYEYEPEEGEILADLLPRNIAVQVFRALLENAASEQGARMSAMDNATRNAGDMINRLTLSYNRQRQAQITKELIEIISGAEAL